MLAKSLHEKPIMTEDWRNASNRFQLHLFNFLSTILTQYYIQTKKNSLLNMIKRLLYKNHEIVYD